MNKKLKKTSKKSPVSKSPLLFAKSDQSIVWVCVLVFLCFAPSLANEFTNWDDGKHLLENELVRSLHPTNIARIFFSTVNDTYIPLTIFSFSIEYFIAKYHPFLYHLTNVLLHCLNVFLVFRIARLFSLPTAAAVIGALIFGIHPMHVESVVWVTQRKDMLYSFFYLVALYQYMKYVLQSDKRNYLVSLVCCFLSLLAKPMAISLPLVLFLFDIMLGRRKSWMLIVEKIPFFLMAAGIGSITYVLNARSIPIEGGEAFLTWIWTLTFYIKKFFLPFPLVPLYALPEPVSLVLFEYKMAAIIGVFLLSIVWFFRRQRWVIFSLGFYFLSIFFLLRFDNQVDVSIVADRFMYLPSLGICLSLGAFIHFLLNSKNKRLVNVQPELSFGVVALILVMMAMTLSQTMLWRNSVTLWSSVIEQYPKLTLPYINRASAFNKIEKKDKALDDYQKVMALDPDYALAYNERAKIMVERKEYAQASEDFKKALAIDPNLNEVYNERGILFKQIGRFDLALKDFNRYVSTNPKDLRGYLNRGVIYLQFKKYDEAIRNFIHAGRIDDKQPEIFYNKGIAYQEIGKLDQAILEYSRAIKLKKDYLQAYNNRGSSYLKKRELALALSDYSRAIELSPGEKMLYKNRAKVYLLMGKDLLAQKDLEYAK